VSKRVLLGNMSCFADVGDPNQRYQKFLKNGVGPFKCFIESLLLFDRIVIPTNDFMPLALLAGVFGEKEIAELLDLEIVKFARFRGLITYVGNGGGILVGQIHSGDEGKPRWMSAPLEEAARIAIEGLDAKINKVHLRNLAVKSSVEFPVEEKQGEFAKLVYDEIAKEPSILAAEGVIELNRLPGVKPTDVRVLSGSY
jgi:uncharacterized membrane protein